MNIIFYFTTNKNYNKIENLYIIRTKYEYDGNYNACVYTIYCILFAKYNNIIIISVDCL
jgi:hypothetical protein